MSDIEKKYREVNFKQQESMERKITLLMNANVRSLAKVIANTSNKNTNYNKSLSKQFTSKKRELRNDLTDLIKENVFSAQDLADKKNTQFVKEVKESL